MNCPKCGADMKEGSLYCELCGEDIHMVPDFEPDLEESLKLSMDVILDETSNQVKSDSTEPETEGPEKAESDREHRHSKILLTVCVAGTVLILGAAITGSVLAYQHNSYEYQLDRAVTCFNQKKYDKAVDYYSRALAIDYDDIDIRFALAEAYFEKGNKIEYEYLLREIIRDAEADEKQLEKAYGRLIAIYKSKGDYKTINDIVMASSSDKIKTTYQKYTANAPEFSYPEGAYTEILPLKLSSSTSGKVYYTLDGQSPDQSSDVYTAPIFLDDGDHVVKACFINEYGVISECITKEYHIEIEQASAPVVNVFSGDYSHPMMISITEANGTVYYTTDGSTPDRHSQIYTGSIPMPVGKSQFKFASVQEDGSVGDVTERFYQLKLNTSLTPADAVLTVRDYLLSNGKIQDEAGHFSPDSQAAYKIEYLYVMNINKTDDYFILAEIYMDEAGTMTKTGSYYAVNIYNSTLYKLQIDDKNNYTLVDIAEEPQ